MNTLLILLPQLIPIFSQRFAACQGQNVSSNPKDAIFAHRGTAGQYDPAFVRQSRPHTKRAIRRSNKGKHRSDSTFIPQNTCDEQTIKFFEHVLNEPAPAVAAAYASGLATKLGDDSE